MLGTFIEAGGRKSGKAQGLDFDELGINEVVELLRYPKSDMEAVLADFDRRNPDEDPVIHFYELFLKEYDAAQKVKRGVFYTPRPVVGFIVRSVDEVLRTEFGLEDGLASTATWGEVIAASKGKEGAAITLPAGAKESDPFVRILDPATGTGTFLVECVDLIHKTMIAKWEAAGKRDAEIRALWNAYVPAHLLPRLYGFELMMAPYAIAHVKLGLKLADTGYTFGSDARAQIHLANALEPAQDLDMQLAFMSEALAHEAKAANAAKETRFTVVLGNPPYAGHSANPAKDKKGKPTYAGGLIERYLVFEGAALGEKQPKWLLDDYVKFVGLSRRALQTSGSGILGFVTNHGYLDNPTFRGMRESLTEDFSPLYTLDLAGSVKKRGQSSGLDENVFDIEQGTAIIIGRWQRPLQPAVGFARLSGSRANKCSLLNSTRIDTAGLKVLTPARPFLTFDRAEAPLDAEWQQGCGISEMLNVGALGIVSGRDDVAFDIDQNVLIARAKRFADPAVTNDQVREEFDLRDAGGYVLSKRRTSILKQAPANIVKPAFFRPFDNRFVIFSRGVLTADQAATMRHLIAGDNLALVTTRTVETGAFYHAVASNCMVANHSLSMKEANYTFPLWLKPQGTETRTLPNIAPAFAARVAALTGLAYDDCVEGPKQGTLRGILLKKAEQTAMFAPARRERGESGKSFGPRDLFDYIYAVLHSPTYRARYADYLKSDFARIPLPGSAKLFEALVPLGTKLVVLHLLDAETLPSLKDPKGIRLAGSGEARVAHKPEYDAKLGRVTINATRWFEAVPQVAWDFHVGGYQPAQKWLKDRAARGGKKASPGRVLTDDDILHYRRMIVALTRTAELMPQVDAVVDKHGGWPGAFRGMSDSAQP